MKIIAYKIHKDHMKIVPGQRNRDWMDQTPNKFAYRCLPLGMANQTGWDIYSQDSFAVHWNGDQSKTGLTIQYETRPKKFVESVFGSGIFTFHTALLFRTEPEWDLLVTGSPNEPVTWATPLTGIVETSWLDFTFTMNWKLHKPGTYRWNKNIPVCRIIPIPHSYGDINTEYVDIDADPEQNKAYREWCDSRSKIINEIKQVYTTGSDAEIVKVGKPNTTWEKNYYVGKKKSGERVSGHNIKRDFPEFE